MKIFLFVLLVCFVCKKTEGTCILPSNLTGAWISSSKGVLQFTSDTISGYPISSFGVFDFNCTASFASKLVFRSTTFSYLGLTWEAYLCLDITTVSSDLFSYYLYSVEEPDAQNERVKIVVSGTNPSVVAVCDRPSSPTGTYDVLVRNDSLSSAKTPCSTDLQATWSYMLNDGNNTFCTGGSSLDVCSDTSTFTFNYTTCPANVAYSAGGSLHCVHEVTNGNSKYLTLLNTDTVTDESTTYRVTCMVYEETPTGYNMTQYPQACLSNQTAVVVTSPGSSITLFDKETCPVPDEPVVVGASTSWVYAVVAVLLIIIIVFIVLIVFKAKKKHAESRDQLRGIKIDKDPLADEAANEAVDGPSGEVPPDILTCLEKEHSFPIESNSQDEIHLTVSTPAPTYRDEESPGPHSLDIPGAITDYHTIGSVRHPSSPVPNKKNVVAQKGPKGGIVPRQVSRLSMNSKYSPRSPRSISGTPRSNTPKSITPRGASVKPISTKPIAKKVNAGPATNDLGRGRRLPPIAESIVAANKMKKSINKPAAGKVNNNKKFGKIKDKPLERSDSAKSTTSHDSMDSASGARPKSRSVSFRQDVEARKRAKRMKSNASMNQSADEEVQIIPPSLSQVKITRVDIPALNQRMSESDLKIQDMDTYSPRPKQLVWTPRDKDTIEDPEAGIRIRRVWLEPEDPTEEVWARVSNLWRLGQTWTEKTINL